MIRCLVSLVFLIALVATVALPSSPADAASCESLASLVLPDTTIVSAASINPPPDFVSPPSALSTAVVSSPFCRVVGIIAPTIYFEVWMPPSSGWNGRFQGQGNGGWTGGLDYRSMASALAKGSATAATNTGHFSGGGDASWAIGHPNLVVDYGYRALHETTVKAKAIIQAFYGTGPRYSYFAGCSAGGRQALMEAERFPGDYNGILVGDPSNTRTHLAVEHINIALATGVDPASWIPPSKVPLIANAVNARCDALDGIVDGIIDDPRRCDFDPRTLQCQGPDADTCLTAAQVTALKKIYAGPLTPSGKQFYPGLLPGAEDGPGGWAPNVFGLAQGKGAAQGLGVTLFQDLVFEDPNWDFRTFDFDDVAIMDAKVGSILNSDNPDLSAFNALGGKIIHYTGWNSPLIPPQNTVNYYGSVVRTFAGSHGEKLGDLNRGHALRETQEFYRLFMVPGMQHCAGGPGPNVFGAPFQAVLPQHDAEHDILTALQQWVEHGVAPERIIATHLTVTGMVDRTRPLCPYPKVARYTGRGSTDDAANFVCRQPEPLFDEGEDDR